MAIGRVQVIENGRYFGWRKVCAATHLIKQLSAADCHAIEYLILVDFWQKIGIAAILEYG